VSQSVCQRGYDARWQLQSCKNTRTADQPKYRAGRFGRIIPGLLSYFCGIAAIPTAKVPDTAETHTDSKCRLLLRGRGAYGRVFTTNANIHFTAVVSKKRQSDSDLLGSAGEWVGRAARRRRVRLNDWLAELAVPHRLAMFLVRVACTCTTRNLRAKIRIGMGWVSRIRESTESPQSPINTGMVFSPRPTEAP
jgi:hypothetical protein